MRQTIGQLFSEEEEQKVRINALANDVSRVLTAGNYMGLRAEWVKVYDEQTVEINDQVCIQYDGGKYYVYYWKSDMGSMSRPPDTWDEEIVTTYDRVEAIRSAVCWFAYADIRDVLYPGTTEDSPVLEEV